MVSLTSAALVAAVAVLVPVAARLCRVTVPESVLEIVIGIVIGIVVGREVLGWAGTDPAVQVLSIIGLGFVLLLAGLDIDLGRLPRRLLAVTVAGHRLPLFPSGTIGPPLQTQPSWHGLAVIVVIAVVAVVAAGALTAAVEAAADRRRS